MGNNLCSELGRRRRGAAGASGTAIALFGLELVELFVLVFLEDLLHLGVGLGAEGHHLFTHVVGRTGFEHFALLDHLGFHDGLDGFFLIFGKTDGFFESSHLTGHHLFGVSAHAATGRLGEGYCRQQGDCGGENERGNCVSHDLIVGPGSKGFMWGKHESVKVG